VSIPWPRCGNEDPHLAHPQPDFSAPDCPGWTKDQQVIRNLVIAVHEYVREHYPVSFFPHRHQELPEGLRLEMHPSVRRALMMDPDLLEPGWPQARDDVHGWFPVPVKVTTDVNPGRWRLVIVTEDVLLDGGGEAPPRAPVDYSDDPAMTGRRQIPFHPDVIYDPEQF
jgi:hypothetical protein